MRTGAIARLRRRVEEEPAGQAAEGSAALSAARVPAPRERPHIAKARAGAPTMARTLVDLLQHHHGAARDRLNVLPTLTRAAAGRLRADFTASGA